MAHYMRFETVTVSELVKNDYNEVKTIVVEDFIHLANGNSFPKRFKISTWNYKGEIPAVGSVVNVKGDPVYDCSNDVNPRNGKRTVYVTLLNPVFEIMSGAPEVVSVETAAAMLGAAEVETPF